MVFTTWKALYNDILNKLSVGNAGVSLIIAIKTIMDHNCFPKLMGMISTSIGKLSLDNY